MYIQCESDADCNKPKGPVFTGGDSKCIHGQCYHISFGSCGVKSPTATCGAEDLCAIDDQRRGDGVRTVCHQSTCACITEVEADFLDGHSDFLLR